MKPRESTIQAKEFQADSLRRQLAQFDRMIDDLEVIRGELAKQIANEEGRTGVTDPDNFAYSTVARAARDRRRNLDATIADLSQRREKAAEELAGIESFFDALRNAAEGDEPAEPGTQTPSRRSAAA
jgi:type II secretory pathway component PulJ